MRENRCEQTIRICICTKGKKKTWKQKERITENVIREREKRVGRGYIHDIYIKREYRRIGSKHE